MYTKLDEAFKQRWITALTDGSYVQGRGVLRDEDFWRDGGVATFCCLGVACDLLDPHGWNDEGWRGTFNDKIEGLEFVNQKTAQTLAGMNDGARMTFAQIADWIGENL